MAGLRLSITCLECKGPLTDDEHLLVLHFVVFVVSVQGRFDIVLYLCFWLLRRVFLLEIDGGWDAYWQDGLELNGIDTWLKHAVNNMEDWAFEF